MQYDDDGLLLCTFILLIVLLCVTHILHVSGWDILMEDKIVFPTVRWITSFCWPQLNKSKHTENQHPVFWYRYSIRYSILPTNGQKAMNTQRPNFNWWQITQKFVSIRQLLPDFANQVSVKKFLALKLWLRVARLFCVPLFPIPNAIR
jgi:hypothetical protein